MFSGPKAESPPKNTFLLVDWNVALSTNGISHWSNSIPRSRSIHGKEFSCPIAINTSSASMKTRPSLIGINVRLPSLSYLASTFSKFMPLSLPSCTTNSRGTWLLKIGMPSWAASAFSHGEAFISSKGLRTTTLTSSPPIRRDVLQQSIAVLPPPRTRTRLPILRVCSNATLDSQSMPK